MRLLFILYEATFYSWDLPPYLRSGTLNDWVVYSGITEAATASNKKNDKY